jgi:hypothetical protein
MMTGNDRLHSHVPLAVRRGKFTDDYAGVQSPAFLPENVELFFLLLVCGPCFAVPMNDSKDRIVASRISRRNAFRHGLSAETVIDGLEHGEDYRGFEAAIIADYDAETAVEREPVLRLASLLWRLRRIIAIETDLFKIQAEILHDRRTDSAPVRDELPDQTPHQMRRDERAGSTATTHLYLHGS